MHWNAGLDRANYLLWRCPNAKVYSKLAMLSGSYRVNTKNRMMLTMGEDNPLKANPAKIVDVKKVISVTCLPKIIIIQCTLLYPFVFFRRGACETMCVESENINSNCIHRRSVGLHVSSVYRCFFFHFSFVKSKLAEKSWCTPFLSYLKFEAHPCWKRDRDREGDRAIEME